MKYLPIWPSPQKFKFDKNIKKFPDSKLNFIENIHKRILRGIKPNIVFVLKVSKRISRKRLKKRKTKNRYDNFDQSFYNKAQNSFIRIAKNKKNYFILDSSRNDNLLEDKIFNVCQKYLNIK